MYQTEATTLGLCRRTRSRDYIKQALDLGINFFDTANVYSDGTSEEIVGSALNDFVDRGDVIVATKVNDACVPHPQASGFLARQSCMKWIKSLFRLGMDYIDLYQIHRWGCHRTNRGNTRCFKRCRQIRQSSLYRRIEHVCMAICKGTSRLRQKRLGAFHQHAKLRQLDLPRGKTRDAAALQRRRRWSNSLEPTFTWSPDPRLG